MLARATIQFCLNILTQGRTGILTNGRGFKNRTPQYFSLDLIEYKHGVLVATVLVSNVSVVILLGLKVDFFLFSLSIT